MKISTEFDSPQDLSLLLQEYGIEKYTNSEINCQVIFLDTYPGLINHCRQHKEPIDNRASPRYYYSNNVDLLEFICHISHNFHGGSRDEII